MLCRQIKLLQICNFKMRLRAGDEEQHLERSRNYDLLRATEYCISDCTGVKLDVVTKVTDA